MNVYISIYHISISYYEYFTCFTTASPCSKEVASKASATVKRSHLSRFSGGDRDDNIDHNEEEEDGEDDDGDHQSGECHRTLHSFPGLEQRVVLSVL